MQTISFVSNKDEAKKLVESIKAHFSDQPLAKQVAQRALKRVQKGLSISGSVEREQDESIHRLRVISKQLRAYLRLIRPGLPSAVFKASDRRLQWMARQLGGQREQRVLMASLTDLIASLPESHRPLAMPYVTRLKAEFDCDAERQRIDWAAVRLVLQRELRSWQNLQTMSLPSVKLIKQCRKTLFKSIRRAERALASSAGSAQRHQWRKWHKCAFYQIKLLKRLGLKLPRSALRHWDELGDSLGREHDLYQLNRFLQQQLEQAPLVERLTIDQMLQLNRHTLVTQGQESDRLFTRLF
jgi:CHAD domain-containing protein